VNISTGKLDLPFPFESGVVLEAAKRLLLTQIQSEIDLCTLVSESLAIKHAISAKKEGKDCKHKENVFANIASLTVWLNHVTKLHATHCEHIFSTSGRFVENVREEREAVVRKTVKDSCRCTVHPEKPAVAKSIDNTKLYCTECLKDQ
jgi:hypothetical protein